MLGNLHGLKCARGDLSGCSDDHSVCANKKGVYLGQPWDRCPVRESLEDPQLLYALQVEREMSVQAVDGWPSNFAGWLVDLVIELKSQRIKRQNTELQRASK